MWYWWKNRQLDEWNIIERPEIDWHKYSQLSFDKGAKEFNGERSLFNIMQNMNPDTDLTPYTKVNLKWIIELNVKCKTIKLLKENIGENLHNIGFDDEFLDTTSKAQFMKEKQWCWTPLK